MTDTVGYKRFNLGRWIQTEDNWQDFLRCPECGCGIIWEWFALAVGAKGTHYCPYCGADMMDGVQEHLEL